MIENPRRAQDALPKRGVIDRLVGWLTGRKDVEITNPFNPSKYD